MDIIDTAVAHYILVAYLSQDLFPPIKQNIFQNSSCLEKYKPGNFSQTSPIHLPGLFETE